MRRLLPNLDKGLATLLSDLSDRGLLESSLKMSTMAHPAVEFLCLVGLQRFRPAPATRRRVFDYFEWRDTLPVNTASVAANGLLLLPKSRAYRFESAFRTAQKKHKSFLPATPIGV